MSTSFVAAVDSTADVEATWRLVTDWDAHTRWTPLTTVRTTRQVGDGGVGTRFTARSGVGPVAFDDPMEVTEWDPPGPESSRGRVAVAKLGRVVLGRAEVVVTPRPGGGSRVEWTEHVDVVPVRLTRLAAPLASVVGRLAFTAVLRRMVAELGRDDARRG